MKQGFVIKFVVESFDIALKRFVICMFNFGSTENLNRENVDIKCTIQDFNRLINCLKMETAEDSTRKCF